MIEQHVIVTTKHGNMPTFTACPDGPGNFPGIIFYMGGAVNPPCR
jgi:carboxymethylenebutenolidase